MADRAQAPERPQPAPTETIEGGTHAGRIINKRINNGVVFLDYGQFINCEFINCQLVYKGGELFSGDTVLMQDSTFIFSNEAQNTLRMLRQMIAMGSADIVMAMIGIEAVPAGPQMPGPRNG